MPTLQEILQDQNYINANPATKKAIFDRWSALDTNYTGANQATQQAIRSRFGVGGPSFEAEPEPARKSTVGSELVRGGKQLASSIRTGAGALMGSPEEAAVAGVARSQAIGEEAGEGASLAAVKKAYQERGLLSAAGEVAGQIPRALASQVPQLAAMAGSAKLGAMAGTAVAPGVGTVVGGVLGAGASLLPQFFGSNVERQAAEQMAQDQPVQIDRGAAGAAAAGQAAIESAGTAFVLGKRIVKGVLGVADDAALTSAKAQQAMTKAAERSLAAAAGRGVAKGALVEIPVEIAQSVLERAQAGLDVTSPEALSEYGEVAYQAGLVGGAIGAGAGPVNTAMARQGVKARTAFEEAEAKRAAEEERARLEAEAAEKDKIPPLALGSEGVFTPVSLPDGSVAMTREDLAQYEEQEFQRKYAAQEADKQPPLALGVSEPFKPVVFPDGSVANTPEDVARYEEQQFEGKYKPQAVPPVPVFEEEPVGKSIISTKPQLEATPVGGELAGIVSGRREAEAAKAEIPLADDYAFLQREKQRLIQQDQTPDTKKLLGRIDERIGDVLKRDIERQRADAEAAKTSVFSRPELPPVESRDVVVGGEELATLQAPERFPETVIDRKEKQSLARMERLREQPAAPESEAEEQMRQLEKGRAKIKSTSLYGELIGKLAPGDVTDISPDIGKNLRVKGGRGGAFLSDIVSSGTLNDYLPPDMRPDAITFDEQEATEYIKDKLRNKDHLTFDATMESRKLDDEIRKLGAEVQAPRAAEFALSDVEPGEAATVERAAGDQAVVESTDQIRYKRSTGKVGIGKQAVQDTINTVKSRWANAPEVVVAENMEDPVIPQEVRDHNKEAVAKGAKGSPQGFYYKGKAYVIADSIGSTNEAVEALMHEALGHFGLRGVFGPKMGAVLRDVVKQRRAEVESKAEQYGLDPKNDADMLEAAEEVLAVMAQTKPGLPFVKRALAVIRNFLRDLGFNIKMSDADIIQKYILPARAFVESGKGRTVEGGVSAMRGQPAPSWVPEKIWRLHELMQRADDEAEGRVPLRENEQGKVPTSGALKRNQTMTFRRLNAAVDEYVGGDYQKSMDLMTRMNQESSRRADKAESRPAAMRGESPKTGPGTAAFDRWFGDSKVVDENGEPLVVYHGTPKDFEAFKEGKTWQGFGFHFGTAAAANEVLEQGRNSQNFGAQRIMPVYLSIKNPLKFDRSYDRGRHDPMDIYKMVMRKAEEEGVPGITESEINDLYDDDHQFEGQRFIDLEGQELRDLLRKWLNSMGYDGIEYENAGEDVGSTSWIAFKPTQVKSATGNIGTYDPENADIRYQREAGQPNPTRQNIFGKPVLGTWSITVDPKMELQDGLIYKMLDKNIDVKRIVEAVKSTGKQIASQWNPYLQEELYHGRTANASQEFQDKEWLPLLQDMEKKGVTVGELEKYLLNRHAEEYNKLVAKRNPTRPEMQDGGSSVTTEAAREYLAGLDKDTKAKYEELAKRIDSITKGTRQLLVDTGYEKAETVKGWEEAFPNYVPLMREEANFDYNFGSFGTGRGFDVRRNFSRSAMGSKRNVVDIIGNVISARNNAIALTEKNRVAQAVYGLAVEAPNPDFWMAINPDAEKVPEDAIDELRAMGLDGEAVKYLMKEPKQRVLDPKRDEIVSRVNTKLRENDYVLATRINGEKRYVFFNPKDPRANRAATALKNLDAQDLGVALGLVAKVTRWMASVNTQYNPIFGPYNFLRDLQSAALQLSTTELAGQQKEIAANVVPSLRVIYSSLRKRRKGEEATGEMASLWKEFQKEGGQTGFRDNFSRTQDRTEALINEMEKISEGKVKANARAVFDWLSDYNDSLENAVRLSAYKVAKEKFAAEGFSESEVKQKAASLAKNLTVNFNRKGDVATQMGALYAFFNASMQGTARMIETLKGPTGKRIIAGGLLLGGMQAALLAAAGFDDEEPPEFIRSKNIVIPTGDGDYIAFPMPLGFHVIPGVSRILTEWTLSGFKDTARRVTDLTGLFLDAFNPIGNAGWSVQTITPTVLDPLVALGENKDWTGKPISKEDIFSLRPTPGYTRAREGANLLSTNLAEFLNYASGGTKHQPGVLSPTPEQIEYLVGQAFGGVGREAMKLATTAEKTVTGEDLPPYKIPLYGRFVGETKSSAAESNKFYKNMERLNRLDLEIKGRREDREPVGDFIRENPEARLLPMANKTYKDVQELRKRRKALLERDASRESIKAVENQITRKMQLLNDRVKAFEER
jgi:hypothetical protein